MQPISNFSENPTPHVYVARRSTQDQRLWKIFLSHPIPHNLWRYPKPLAQLLHVNELILRLWELRLLNQPHNGNRLGVEEAGHLVENPLQIVWFFLWHVASPLI
jgi:hypothetical protein